MAIQNGDKVKDMVSGFSGVVTGVAEYMTGCRQCCVIPESKDGKWNEGQWFDDDRLELVEAGAVKLTRQRDGGPQSNQAPIR